jgi:putative transposase
VRGYDAAKLVKGRRWQLLVDTLGFVLNVVVTEGCQDDRDAAFWLLASAKPRLPRLKKVWADAGYREYKLLERIERELRITVEIVPRPRHQRRFRVLPKRWLVERSFSWFNHARRLSKDYEDYLKSSVSMLYAASIRLLLPRLATPPAPP